MMRRPIVVYEAMLAKWIEVMITDTKKQAGFIGSEQVYHFSSGYNFALFSTLCLSATAASSPGT